MAIWRKVFIQFVLTVVSVILISGLPELILKKSMKAYIGKVGDVCQALLHPEQLKYIRFEQKRAMFPDVFDSYFYSLLILIVSFLLAFLFAQLLTWATFALPDKGRLVIKNILTFMESFPDLLVFALVQIFIVFFYKQTNILLSDVATVGNQRIYVIPIMCLSILPLIYFYKMMVLLAEEESKKPYVEFSLAKGLTMSYVLLYHMTRNTHQSLFHFSKTVLWMMISNLLLVEWIFNINGIMYYLYSDFRAENLAVVLILLSFPFFMLFGLVEYFLSVRFKREVEA